MDKLSTQEILDARLDDWRKLAQGLHARYRVKDFTAAVPFAAAIAEAAAAEGHQPDVRMTQDVVDLSLYTRDDGLWVTDKDVGMAQRISEIARQQGLTPEPAAVTQLELALDAADEKRVGPFWSALLTGSPDNQVYDGSVFDPTGRVPSLWFQGTGEHEPPWRRAGPSSMTTRRRPSPCLRIRTATASVSALASSGTDGGWSRGLPSPGRRCGLGCVPQG